MTSLDREQSTGGAQHGDVVITRDARSPVRFTVRQLPGVVQFSAATRDEALRIARGYAKRHGLDVWYGEGAGLRLVEGFRTRGKPITRAGDLPSA